MTNRSYAGCYWVSSYIIWIENNICLLDEDEDIHENTCNDISSSSEGPGPGGDKDNVMDISEVNENFPDENMEVSLYLH